MLLGASGERYGLEIDLDVAVDASRSGDAGVPHGAQLLAFASAANHRSDDVASARAALASVAGDDGVLEAAATVAAFNGLVRVADGTGIQLDPSMMTSTAETRARLGLDLFAGAANSVGAPSEPDRRSELAVEAMFD